MTAFLIRRIALAVATLFAVLTFVFVVVRILPGDPAQLILGDQASREAIEALHVRLGLDQPILLQYASFLGNALNPRRNDDPLVSLVLFLSQVCGGFGDRVYNRVDSLLIFLDQIFGKKKCSVL